MIDKVQKKEEMCLAVIGQGYVGLPLTRAFGKVCRVVAYDIDEKKVEKLRRSVDPNGEMGKEEFDGLDVEFTTDENRLDEATYYVIAVPTPVDGRNHPNLCALELATRTVGRHLKSGDIVVFESTVYPGCTEEVCMPILERESGLKCGEDFGLGYSPERINPGDREHSIESVIKVVSGRDYETREKIVEMYEKVVFAGIHRAPSIKVAEAAKIIENTQRDLNIALMNELSIIFGRMGIDTRDVIEAASTKWNFLPFSPGLVGGHCIGVDPYYLDFKASELGYHTQIINRGRYVNDNMGKYVADETAKRMAKKGMVMKDARVLLIGLTYKEDVCDIRNSKSVDIINELMSFGIMEVDVYDPMVNREMAREMYGIEMTERLTGKYDAIIIAVAHRAVKAMISEMFFDEYLSGNGVVSDIKGICRNKVYGIDMWRL